MAARQDQWRAAIAAASDEAALGRVESQLFGKKGEVLDLVKSVASLPAEERPTAGRAANELKIELQQQLDSRRAELSELAMSRSLAAGDFDPSEPEPSPSTPPRGTLHPITIVQNELIDLFSSLGFTWADGPEIETAHYNYDALNTPDDHPARDTTDTFWLDGEHVLRTHTSPVQVRSMLRFKPPMKVIAPGRCFRCETVDASHEHTFYQVEGLVVDRGISTANLIHTMKTCLAEILQRDIEMRLRPGFFPFVEPGFELDIHCPFCDGAGCKVCKKTGWIEIMPCGMVHPNVLKAGGIDPEEFTGFAFGMGVQRVVMLRYGIDDIRLFMGGDLRFLSQFGEVGP